MEQTNVSVTTYFIISGISDSPTIRLIIFIVALLIYLLTLGGNLTVLLLIATDHQLHTPMYFFLANLSVLDISCSTITLHKILLSFMTGNKFVSIGGCMVQIFIFFSMSCNELLILTAMSYDRYVAICNPLNYHMIMNRKICTLLSAVCWVLSSLENFPTFLAFYKLSCYKSNIINHFFCDAVPVIKLTCSDTTFLEMYMLSVGGFIAGMPPFVLTFISYVFIISVILKIPSSIGRHKAFYTCSSHITVVILFYTTLIFQYLRPYSLANLDSNKVSSLFNTALVPMLNPLIYSLKNKDVTRALKQRFLKFSQN
ncbi:olfactory receptor 1019-like [Bufo gargarizans]|uniref:olfactory receptor 1019-like n=1 Tax=Bufo gargarizans TaxID=30331 RepID=UPI001CF3A0EA|nr:olfactory receptor 1019-like [Bufo gargarizans]